tara:strand:- start:390 stop:566 length:177 start_codon:yes stop_codon:yes gene_type:complete
MENIRQKIVEIIIHTHKTPLEQADEILLLFSVSGTIENVVGTKALDLKEPVVVGTKAL